jgi:hypothetical protein
MHGLIVSKEQTAREILLLLEAALRYSHSSDKCIVKQLLHWDLAVKFAKFHQMKLPEEFLKHCAKEDLWLPFVLFIQLHQYPVDQVSSSASFKCRNSACFLIKHKYSGPSVTWTPVFQIPG